MTSTINPSIPAYQSDLISGPIRDNFAAAANDINALQSSVTALQNSVNVLNIFTPEMYATPGQCIGAVGNHDGIISGGSFNQFSSPSYSFGPERVNTLLWFDATERTITSVNAGVATFSPAASGASSGNLWLNGTDDTTAIQAALNAARNVQGDYIENSGAVDGLINSGGICQLAAGKAYIISNSQANYNSGILSCLRVGRRVDFKGAGIESSRSSLCLRPGSYGHMVAPTNPESPTLSFSDFVGIGYMTLYGYNTWSPNALDGIYWKVANNGYDKTDPFNRFYDITTHRMRRNGFTFTGRGELIVERCQAFGSLNYGFNVFGQADYKINSCNSGGNSKTGMRIFSSGAGHWVNCKSFYNGSDGGSNDADCANWYINADQLRNGLVYFTQCEGQESRGSSWVIDNAGLCTLDACQGLDPGRDALSSSGTLPTVIAGLHIKGTGACNNTFSEFYAGPSVAIFSSTNNWGRATDAIYIAGVAANGSGPQNNQGTFLTFLPSIKSDGTLDPGTHYRPGFGPIGGSGTTNGRNNGCFINSVRFVSAIPAAPVNLTATPAVASAILDWDLYFPGGMPGTIAVTDYVIEYKLHADVSWTTFSHSPITEGPITVTGLTNNLFYDFRVSAVNSVGTGPTTTISNVQILVTVPDQVSGLVATGGQGFVALTWTIPFNGNSPITDYFVEYKLTASGSWLTLGHTASALPTQYLIDVDAASYDFRVSAVNAIGTGAVSATASATPTEALFDFDASVTANITDAGAGAVSAFVDATANAYSAVQATGANRPVTGVATINGLNAISFDGTNDFLQATLPVTGCLAGSDYAFMVVAMRSTAVSGTRISMCYNTNSGANRRLDMAGSSNFVQSLGAMTGSGNDWVCSSSPATIGGVVTLSAVRVRRTLQTVLYSSLTTPKTGGVSSNNPFTMTTDQRLMIGSFSNSFGFFQGDFGQAKLIGTNLTDANVNGIMNAMAYKWGTTWTNI